MNKRDDFQYSYHMPLAMAQAIALNEQRRVLVMTGPKAGSGVLPSFCSEYEAASKLRSLQSYGPEFETRIITLHPDVECTVIDALQGRGGYSGFVVDEEGAVNPSYEF